MKLFLYLFLFLAILGIAGFGFFSITTPTIPQNTIKKDIDPKEAFGNQQTTLSPAPSVTDSSSPSVPVDPSLSE